MRSSLLKMVAALAVSGAAMFAAGPANAAYISKFTNTTNDGTRFLTPSDAAALGLSSNYNTLGLFRVQNFCFPSACAIGDTFDAATILASITGSTPASLVASSIFSGYSPNSNINYGAAPFQTLGIATLLAIPPGGGGWISGLDVAFAWDGTQGNVVFLGTDTFSPCTTLSTTGNCRPVSTLQGFPGASVPEPSTIALIAMALLSLFSFGLMRRRAEA
jgi:hypothetical protein